MRKLTFIEFGSQFVQLKKIAVACYCVYRVRSLLDIMFVQQIYCVPENWRCCIKRSNDYFAVPHIFRPRVASWVIALIELGLVCGPDAYLQQWDSSLNSQASSRRGAKIHYYWGQYIQVSDICIYIAVATKKSSE